MLSDEKIIDMARANGVNATRLSTVIDLCRASERAARKAAIRDLYAIIDNDAYAVSLQMTGQYRAALRSAIRALREES